MNHSTASRLDSQPGRKHGHRVFAAFWEWLTRHEGPSPASEVARDRVVTQDDDFAALTQSPTGRGMTEMRERAELYGGVLNTIVTPGVGFTVMVIPELSAEQPAALVTFTVTIWPSSNVEVVYVVEAPLCTLTPLTKNS